MVDGLIVSSGQINQTLLRALQADNGFASVRWLNVDSTFLHMLIWGSSISRAVRPGKVTTAMIWNRVLAHFDAARRGAHQSSESSGPRSSTSNDRVTTRQDKGRSLALLSTPVDSDLRYPKSRINMALLACMQTSAWVAGMVWDPDS